MIIKSLLNISENLLPEFDEIKNLNPENWDIGEYLNLKYDINAAIAFSKLFYPNFIVKDGCIIIGFRYNEESFKKWYKHYNGNIREIERMCNKYELMDYFSINRKTDEALDSYNMKIDELGKVLKKSWEINCLLLFPEKKINVEVFDEFNTTRLTLYSV